MKQDEFVYCYYELLLRKLEPFNVDRTDFIDALNTGAYYMVLNDGTRTNKEAFWKGYETVLPHP